MNANFSEWDDNVFFKKQYELFLTKKKKKVKCLRDIFKLF